MSRDGSATRKSQGKSVQIFVDAECGISALADGAFKSAVEVGQRGAEEG